MTICEEAGFAVEELINKAKLKKGDIILIGGSTSEINGSKIGTNSKPETGKEIIETIMPVINKYKLYLAVQCCEHLNRAIVIEKELAEKNNIDIVNVVPQPKAGGSLATAAYNYFVSPVLCEHIKADAGMDIGGVLIGMNLKDVAVPLRLSISKIGSANIICARTRPKFIGGVRAVYDENML